MLTLFCTEDGYEAIRKMEPRGKPGTLQALSVRPGVGWGRVDSIFKVVLSVRQPALADIPFRTGKSGGGSGLWRKAISLTLDVTNETMGQPSGHVQGATADAIRGGLRPGLSTSDL